MRQGFQNLKVPFAFTDGKKTAYVMCGRIIKVEKNADRDFVTEDANGRYPKHGIYKGTKCDITFSMYDTDSFFIELDGEQYKFLSHQWTFDVYERVKAVLGRERMPSETYDGLLSYQGKTVDLGFEIVEKKTSALDVLQGENRKRVLLRAGMPFQFNEEVIFSSTWVDVEKVNKS